jgi:hypothetical protein
MTAKIPLPLPNDKALDAYRGTEKRAAFYQEVLRRVSALAGVEQAANHHEVPNVCAKNHLGEGARRSLKRMRPTPADYRIMETGFFIRSIPLYYAGFSKYVNCEIS